MEKAETGYRQGSARISTAGYCFGFFFFFLVQGKGIIFLRDEQYVDPTTVGLLGNYVVIYLTVPALEQ